MNRALKTICCSIGIFAATLTISTARVQPEMNAPVKIVLHPAAEPIPALKYRLLPSRLEQLPGNAAVYYGKVTAEETRFFSDRELAATIEAWQEAPFSELCAGQAKLPSKGSIEFHLRRAARYRDCDWQLPIGDVPFYQILLPDVQQMRYFGRILGARARIQMSDGEFDDAVETIEAGYAAARHVAQGETVVNGLVGIAICGLMNRQLRDFVQQPDAPNLYWALTQLPHPLIDMRDAIDVEQRGVELSYPQLRDLQTATLTPQQWQDAFHRFAAEVGEQLRINESPPPPTSEQIDARCHQMFPQAKRRLIADGMPAEDVENLGVHQVALLYSLAIYHQLVDDAIKHYFLPYPQAIAGIDSVAERVKREQLEIVPIGEQILRALAPSRRAIVRNEREIAVLRVLEALRLYAAAHEGRLPDGLEDITEVPVPDDPVTGEPFGYLRSGDTALLQGPTIQFGDSRPQAPLKYEITMVARE